MGFQRYSREEARQAMAVLAKQFKSEQQRLVAPANHYSESQARLDYIDKFLMILGWDVRNEDSKPQHRRDVVVEETISEAAGGALSRPDYTCRDGRKPRLPVEAKKPSINLATSGEAAIQARNYGWVRGLPCAVLTNFAETVFFDTTITPQVGDGPDVAVRPGGRFSVDNYVERFDELWELLSFEVVASEDFERVFGYVEPPRGTSAFDQTFLAEFRDLRLKLAVAIADGDGHMSPSEVGRRAQGILDAILFLRVCEDRNIETYHRLGDAADEQGLRDLFRHADKVYGAGLFAVLENTIIDPLALTDVVSEFYWPNSKFAFGFMATETLAALYEQLLAEHVEISPTGAVSLVRKPEVVHAGGAVPTPDFIVNEIVDRVVKPRVVPMLGARQPRILGPACGSGIFEVTAFKTIVAVLEDAGLVVDLAERCRIAKECIYAVDIDPSAVEVTRLSLLLAILGEEDVDIATARGLLPDLSRNIISGNFIVGPNFDSVVPHAAAVPARRAAVSPLNMAVAFADVAAQGGFDAIIGNPPFVRIQVLSEVFPDQLEYFQDPRSGFQSPQAHNFDEYMLFVERALSLIAPDGEVGFLVPNRFTNVLAAAPLRAMIGPRLARMVHFTEEQVFPGRSTYTALVFVGSISTEDARIEIVRNLDAWRAGVAGELMSVARDDLAGDPWPIAPDAVAEVLAKMDSSAIGKLGTPGWVEIFVGVQTSADDVFFLPSGGRLLTGGTYEFTDRAGMTRSIEQGILRPAVKDTSLTSYDVDPVPDRWCISPYEVQPPAVGSKRPTARLLTRKDMMSRFSLALEYVEDHIEPLSARSVQGDDGRPWRYGRSQSLTKMSQPKLIVRTLSLRPQSAFDAAGLVVPGGGDGGPYYLMRIGASFPYSIEVLQALMSYPPVDAYIASRGKAYRGSYVVHRKAFMVDIPVPHLSPRAVTGIETRVQELRTVSLRLRSETDAVLRRSLGERKDFLAAEVEGIISEAFGLSQDDLRAIEG